MEAGDRRKYTRMAFFIKENEVSENNLLHIVTK